MFKTTFTIFFFSFFLFIQVYAQYSKTIISSKDCCVFNTSPTTNFNDPFLDIYNNYGTNNTTAYTYIYFDISSLPANATITSATLKIYCNGQSGNTTGLTISKLAANSSWSESGTTWNNKPSLDVPPPIQIYFIVGSTNSYTQYDVKPIVQAWYNGDYANNGFQLSTSNGQYAVFYARENGANPPYLIINYDTAPSAPKANSATNITDNSFTANWGSVNGADGYRLDVSTNNNFSNFVSGYQDLNVGNTTNYSVTGLTGNTNYYYRVRAHNYLGTSNNSNVIFITTSVTPPSTPTATSATNTTNSSFTANWNSVSSATGYRLDVSTDNAFSSYLAGYQDIDVGNVTNYDVSGLNGNTNYYYRVRAYNSGATSGNSNTILAVTAINPPSAPAATNATNTTNNSFTANWYSVSGATGYRLDVSTDNAFSSYLAGYQDINVNNTINYSVTNLASNSNYFYRVRAYNSSGTSNNSDTIQVTTTVDKPIISSTTNITDTSFTANWNSVSGAAGYRLDVSTNNVFSSYVTGYQDTNVYNSTSYNVTGLSGSTNYYYRVRAYSVSGISGPSSDSVLVTTQVTAIEQNGLNIPKTYSLSQNYPNPFNPATIINYSVPEQSFVNISIYNILGKKILTLVNEEKRSGNYEITFDGSNLTSGTYFYRMVSKNFSETKKLILLK